MSIFSGLYRAAIMLSGSSLDSFSLTRSPLSFAKKVASSLKIKTRKVEEMVEELKKCPAEDIQKIASSKFKSVKNYSGNIYLFVC